MLILFWALDQWGPTWWETLPLWVDFVVVAVGIIVAQYLAWRSAWRQRGVPEEPYVSPGLYVRYQKAASRSDGQLFLEIQIEAEIPIMQKRLHLVCDGPIYSGEAEIALVDERDQPWSFTEDAIHPEDVNSLFIDFAGEWLWRGPNASRQEEVSKASKILRIWLPAPPARQVRLTRVEAF